jgi:protein involved in polysaccharide export with SLBB domain
MGEVQSQGALPFSDKLTAIAAIGHAKGFSDFANKKSVKLVRGEKSYQLDLSSADSSHARTKLLPGDVLVVKAGRW